MEQTTTTMSLVKGRNVRNKFFRNINFNFCVIKAEPAFLRAIIRFSVIKCSGCVAFTQWLF